MATSGTTNDNEWQQVIQRVITNDNEWQRVVQRMKMNFGFRMKQNIQCTTTIYSGM